MKEMKTEFNYKGKKYPLAFNLNVMQEIQEEYETIDKWTELTTGEEVNAKAIIFGFKAMINEGVDMYNEEHEDKRDFFTHKQIGRMITEIGMDKMAEKLQETVINSNSEEPKNV